MESIYLSKRTINEGVSLFIKGGMLGCIVFVFLYGFYIINPTFDLWLKVPKDLGQNYIAWKAFRKSDWNFPYGLFDTITYPSKISILFMDAVPILELVFKMLSPILPSTFQYHGMWGLFCFMMQGGISCLLIRKCTKSHIVCLLSSIFFLISPVLIMRVYAHPSLGAHWLILLSLCLWLYGERLFTWKIRYLMWGILFFILPLIHIYFVPMCFFILFGYCVQNMLESKQIKPSLLLIIVAISSTFISMLLVGAFSAAESVSLSASGYGLYGSNLNALFLHPHKTALWEGSGYLGLGIIALLSVSLVLLIVKKTDIHWAGIKYYAIAMSVVAITGYILAVIPTITFSDNILFTVSLPDKIVELLSVFRANGRFIWLVWYILTLNIFYIIIKNLKKSIAIAVITVAVFIQGFDLKDLLLFKHSESIRINEQYFYGEKRTELENAAWNVLGYTHAHIFLSKDKNIDATENNIFEIANFALDNNMTLNNFYLSRGLSPEYLREQIETHKESPQDDTIYIYVDESWTKLYIYEIDGLMVGVTDGTLLEGVDDVRLVSVPQ